MRCQTMVDKCNKTNTYPNGLELTIENAIKGGDFQIEEYVCRDCKLLCQRRIDEESMIE